MNVPFLDASRPVAPIPIQRTRDRAAHSGPHRRPFLVQALAFVAAAAAAAFTPAGVRAEDAQARDAKTQAGASELPVVSSLASVRAGSLLLRDGERYVEAPRVATDIDITVSGPTSRARVTQIFDNPTKDWVEAVYVNPLPDGGAVDTLRMVIGERFVIGDIKERGEAKAIYEEARRTGRKATLFEQERPNIFTNSIANIGPGERVVVQIEYQEPVRRSASTSSLRVPLVVAPRYNPAPVVQTVDFNTGDGWGRTANDPVPDRDRITPPVLDPRAAPPVNPVAITVHLNAGFPLGEVRSHHHAVSIEAPAADARVIRLDSKVTPADRDFELTWTPAAADAPSVGLFREHVGDADYVLALVTPPVLADARKESPAREIVFVIDNSGSMSGTSIEQAKASLLFALGRLKPNDRFNVIRFDHTMSSVFGDTVMADAGNIDRARRFVSAIQASGGTEMVPPMKAALTDRRGDASQYLRQVVFLTDGEIGNEQELFNTIAAMRGRSRVFMVGIGSAPNSFLMTRASEIGRGTYTHIGSVDQVQERMRELTEKLESPAVTGLTVRHSAGPMDATPDPLPDLYRGEPVVIAARLGSLDGMLEIKGMIGDRPWTVTLPVARAAEGGGLSKLWARRKITDAEMARRHDRAAAADADKRILALALEHHLVSRLTSLVAVDATPARPEGARLARVEVPLNLPAGWEFDKVFGGERPVHDKRPPVIKPEPVEQRADDAAPPERMTGAPVAFVNRPAPYLYHAAPAGTTAHAYLAAPNMAAPPRAAAPKTEETLRQREATLQAQEERRRDEERRQAALGLAGRGPAVPDAFPSNFADVAVLPAGTGSGSMGSFAPGGASLAPEEVQDLRERIVSVLERTSDAVERVWTSPVRKIVVRLVPAATIDGRMFEAEVRRKPGVDALPKFEVVGATYAVRAESPIHAGFSTDKPEVEHLQPGDKIFILGQVASDRNWLIAARDGEAIGYVPADRVQKEQAGPDAPVPASGAQASSPSSPGTTDRVTVVTRCRALNYAIDVTRRRNAIDASRKPAEAGILAACRSAQGGWLLIAEGKPAGAQSPANGKQPPARFERIPF